jgi:hypothetical protein
MISPQEKAAFQVLKIAIDLAQEGQFGAASELVKSAIIAFGDNVRTRHPLGSGLHGLAEALQNMHRMRGAPRPSPPGSEDKLG